MIGLNFQALAKVDRVGLVAAAIALISLFLPWYGVSNGIYGASVSGWGSGYGLLGGLLVVAAGVYRLLQRAGIHVPGKPLSPAFVVLAASVLGTLLVALRWITMPSRHFGFNGVTALSYGPRLGIWIALLAGAVEAGAMMVVFKDSGEKMPWAQAAAEERPQP